MAARKQTSSTRSKAKPTPKDVVKKAVGASKEHGWGAIKSTDDLGNYFDSELERGVFYEFLGYQERGLLKDLARPKKFYFEKPCEHCGGLKLARSWYTPDLGFDCLQTFTVDSLTGPITFEAGRHYICDVKSPKTYNDASWRMKKKLMFTFHGINVVEIRRRHVKPKLTPEQKAAKKIIAAATRQTATRPTSKPKRRRSSKR